MEIHSAARKHGYSDQAILHAIRYAVTIVDLEPDTDPPRTLAIGPDQHGNLLEVIWLDLDAGSQLVIHAMALRPLFHHLLPQLED
ncbi:MAG: hypothetical protein OXN95_03385 [bacterium]|nr:hypothetical protein [bacterium]